MTASHSRKQLILALACVAQFMVVLDIAIVNVALPSIQQDLDLKQSTLQWVVIAYGLLLGGFLLLGGRLGDLLGRRRVFLAGLTIFSIASLISGIAQSADVLIAARALQGFGAAMLSPSALSILAVTFTAGRERNSALGVFGAVGGSSASVGVIASGLLTDGPGWRWIFFINLPVGALLILLALQFLPADAPDTGRRSYDIGGAAAVTGGLLLLVYGLNRGVDHGWTSASTLSLFVASVICFAGFVAIETQTPSPLVPFGALKDRTMISANLIGFCLFGGFFSFIFLGSLLMQQQLHYSPTKTGLAWLASSVLAFVAAAITGAKLVGVLGVKRLLISGMVLLTISALWLTRVPADGSYVVDLMPALLLAGVAIGVAAPTVQIGALSRVTSERIGLVSGVTETMREIGGAVGIAAVSTVLVSQTTATAIIGGYQSAFVVIVVMGVLGLVVALIALPPVTPPPVAVFDDESALATATSVA